VKFLGRGRSRISGPWVGWLGFGLVLLAAGFSWPSQARTVPPITKGEALTLARCLEIGLERQPTILAARGLVQADRALVRQAQSAYWPQVDLSASASRNSTGPRSSLGFSTPSVTFNSYSAGVNLSQTITDFGRTAAEVSVNRYNLAASQTDLDNATQAVVLQIKQAYYGVLVAQRNREAAAQAVEQNQLHLNQAQGFYDVGLKSLYDVTQARVNLSNAKLTLIRAENSVKQSFSLLNQAMGVVDAPGYLIEDNLAYRKYPLSFEEALARAYENRPDLKSQVARRQAAQSAVSLARSNFLPVLSGSAAYSYGGNSFPLSSGWSVGLSLSFPVFSGFLTVAQVEQAQASLSVQRADEEALRQTVYIEVQQAYLSLVEAEDLIPAAELGVREAQENLDIVNGQYAEGLSNPVSVSDAEAAMIAAQVAYYSALYQYKIAQASLEKAMGLK
jgi:outer membrane protein